MGSASGAGFEDGAVALLSRRDKDWTAEFPTVAAAAGRLKVRTALLDGEVAGRLPDGRTSLLAMGGGAAAIAYFAFDIIHLDGEDLTALPTEERKAILRRTLGEAPPPPIIYVDHVVGSGRRFFEEAQRLRLEGIISKARAAPYRPGARNATWQKTKCTLRQELVIGGWTDSVRGGLAALMLGYYDERGQLVYVGKVGTGFQRQEKDLLARLAREGRPGPPFDVDAPTGAEARAAHWVEPRLVCEVEFLEWTEGGNIRHPSFQGLRPDKDPREVVRERPAAPGGDRDG